MDKTSKKYTNKSIYLSIKQKRLIFPIIVLLLSTIFLSFNFLVFISNKSSKNSLEKNNSNVLGIQNSDLNTQTSNPTYLENKRSETTYQDYIVLADLMENQLNKEELEIIELKKSIEDTKEKINHNNLKNNNINKIEASLLNSQEKLFQKQTKLNAIKKKISNKQDFTLEEKMFLLSAQ